MRRMRFAGWISLGAVLMFVTGVSAVTAGDSYFFTSEASVLRAQKILVGDGYLEQDSFEEGILDGETRQALAQYQSEHALNNRGFLDEETFHSLTSHETAYPWGGAPAAVAEPYEGEAAEEVEVAESPEVPEPSAAVEEKEVAVAQSEPPEEPAAADEPAPAMPATGSSLPLLALSGLALLGTGALLLRRSA